MHFRVTFIWSLLSDYCVMTRSNHDSSTTLDWDLQHDSPTKHTNNAWVSMLWCFSIRRRFKIYLCREAAWKVVCYYCVSKLIQHISQKARVLEADETRQCVRLLWKSNTKDKTHWLKSFTILFIPSSYCFCCRFVHNMRQRCFPLFYTFSSQFWKYM